MSKEDDFLTRWHSESYFYEKWGEYIAASVTQAVEEQIFPLKAEYFLKTIVKPRLKHDNKLIEKAYYRNKDYQDAYSEITDKVGIRFVVLLGSDVRTVETALKSIDGWTRSRDRDYDEEQNRNPVSFEYAAVHYIVRPEVKFSIEGVEIPEGTPCEVQIKTILQHAYSELTHDTIYKPQIQATSAMQRNAAKAMALLEATNDYFEKVSDQGTPAIGAVESITKELSALYKEIIGLDASPSLLEGFLIESYELLANDDFIGRIRKMVEEKPFIIDKIKERLAARNPLFAQPSILLAYLDISNRGRRSISSWPLTPKEMEPLLNDFGESVD